MWVVGTDRRALLEMFESENWGRSVRAREQRSVRRSSAPGEELQMMWRDDPRERPSLPTAIVLEESKRRDFLAWVRTYLPSINPFTAYCRVVDAGMAEKALEQRTGPWLGKLEHACLGLILTEAITYMRGRPVARELSRVTCASTYSYAMARSVALGIRGQEEELGQGWSAARAMTNQRKLTPSPMTLLEPWGAVLSLVKKESLFNSSVPERTLAPIVSACMDLPEFGEISPVRWRQVTREYPALRDMGERMDAPREIRVTMFEEALSALRERGRVDQTSGAFLCGYLASRIAPGTLDHVALLTPTLEVFPMALVWYGLCAGLHGRSRLHSHSGGLGYDIIRELTRGEHFIDRPRCDIALAELEVLTDAEGPTLGIRGSNPGQLEVEIAPCINTVLRWPPRTDSSDELFPTDPLPPEARDLLRELDQVLDGVEVIRRKWSRMLGRAEGPSTKPARRQPRR